MTQEQQQLKELLNVACELIARAQQTNGSFLSLSAAQPDYSDCLTYNTTFFTSIILGAISQSQDPQLLKVKRQALDFLWAQQSPLGSFNYWNRQTDEFVSLPYPDDLDDTFAALGAIAANEPESITGEVLAHAVQLLTAQEEKPGGPYRTWLVDSSAPLVWRDIDVAVNANIAWFLKQQKVQLPGLTEFLEQRISSHNYSSPYYPSVYPVIYFLSRGYEGPLQTSIIQFLLDQGTNHWGDNPLDTVLAVCSLLRLGSPAKTVEPALKYLLASFAQQRFGAHPFCSDPAKAGQKYFAGSIALTASIHYEAVTLYWQALEQHNNIQSANINHRFVSQVTKAVSEYFASLPADMAGQAAEVLKQTLSHDLDSQIIQLPLWFGKSLGQRLDLKLLRQISAANIYGWMAYTIYDDIIDEGKHIGLLPLANICLRQVIKIYQPLPGSFGPIFAQIMDRLEAANSWELANARMSKIEGVWVLPETLPDYSNYLVLAEKSLGHALGPLAVLSLLGYTADSPEMANTQQMLEHYLIARQLNDDAHDWQEDLAMGQLNSVAVLVLERARQQRLIDSALDLTTQLPSLQQLFWQELIGEVAALIIQHTNAARDEAKQLKLNDMAWLERMLVPLEKAASEAQGEAAKAKDFLQTYLS